MTRTMSGVLALIVGAVLVVPTQSYAAAAVKKPIASSKYAGSKKCKMCHSKAKMAGTAYTTWAAASHAKAFEALKSDKAKEAATKLGVADPTTDERCLKCHTTPDLAPTEGVSCERCHGAAKAWYKTHGKKNLAQRPSKEELTKAGKKDMTEKAAGAEGPGVREKLCLECHKKDPDNLFHKPFDFAKSWAKISHGKKGSAAEKK